MKTKTIHKYTLDQIETKISIPVGAELLAVQRQGENICVWAKVSIFETQTEVRQFKVVGTGWEFDDVGYKFIDTVQFNNGGLIYHVFELVHNRES